MIAGINSAARANGPRENRAGTRNGSEGRAPEERWAISREERRRLAQTRAAARQELRRGQELDPLRNGRCMHHALRRRVGRGENWGKKDGRRRLGGGEPSSAGWMEKKNSTLGKLNNNKVY